MGKKRTEQRKKEKVLSTKKKAKEAYSKETKKNIKVRRLRILIIGIGGGGSSIVNEMSKSLKGVSFVAADTDQRSFKKLYPKVKAFSFGEELTRGWGTGVNLETGEKAALAAKERIKKLFQGWDLVVMVSCLGGGVSSGSSAVFSEALKEQNILSLGVFTLPFNFEGEKKMRLAKNSLEKIKSNLSGFIVLPNEEVLKQTDKKVSLKKSLSLLNQNIADYFQKLFSTINNGGIINVDFADLKTILKGRGKAICFSQASSSGANRIQEALKEIFGSPFFNCPQKVQRILFNIGGGGAIALRELKEAAEQFTALNSRAKIIFGISKEPGKDLKKISLTVLVVGENTAGRSADSGLKYLENNKALTKKRRAGREKTKKQSGVKGENKKKKKIKVKIRRSALDIKKEKEEIEEKEFFSGNDWDVPAFLRRSRERE